MRLELTEEGVLILPALQSTRAQAAGELAAGLAAAPEARGWRGHEALAFLRKVGDRASGLPSRLRWKGRGGSAGGKG